LFDAAQIARDKLLLLPAKHCIFEVEYLGLTGSFAFIFGRYEPGGTCQIRLTLVQIFVILTV
jgi:hypothetical protein